MFDDQNDHASTRQDLFDRLPGEVAAAQRRDGAAFTPPLRPAPHVARRLEVRSARAARLGGGELAPPVGLWDQFHCHHGWDDVEDGDFGDDFEVAR